MSCGEFPGVANAIFDSGLLAADLRVSKRGVRPMPLSQGLIEAGAELGVLLLPFILGLQCSGGELKKNLRFGLPAPIFPVLWQHQSSRRFSLTVRREAAKPPRVDRWRQRISGSHFEVGGPSPSPSLAGW